MEVDSAARDKQRACISLSHELVISVDDEVEMNSTSIITPARNHSNNLPSSEPQNCAELCSSTLSLDAMEDIIGERVDKAYSNMNVFSGVDKEDLKPAHEAQRHHARRASYLDLDTTSSPFKTSIFDEEDRSFNTSNDVDRSVMKMHKRMASPPFPFSPPSTPPFPFSPPLISSPVSGVAFFPKSHRNENEKCTVMRALEIALALSFEDDESVKNEGDLLQEGSLDKIDEIITAAYAETCDLVSVHPKHENVHEDVSPRNVDSTIYEGNQPIIDNLNRNVDILSAKQDSNNVSCSVESRSLNGKNQVLNSTVIDDTVHHEEDMMKSEKISNVRRVVISNKFSNSIENLLPNVGISLSKEANYADSILHNNKTLPLAPSVIALILPSEGIQETDFIISDSIPNKIERNSDDPNEIERNSDVPNKIEENSDVPNKIEENSAVPNKIEENSDVPYKIEENSEIPKAFVSSYSFSLKSPFGYSQSAIWPNVDTELITTRIKKSRNYYLGGGACGVAADKLQVVGYEEHVGMWRGWPYDCWTCCNTQLKVCPATIVPSDITSTSCNYNNKSRNRGRSANNNKSVGQSLESLHHYNSSVNISRRVSETSRECKSDIDRNSGDINRTTRSSSVSSYLQRSKDKSLYLRQNITVHARSSRDRSRDGDGRQDEGKVMNSTVIPCPHNISNFHTRKSVSTVQTSESSPRTIRRTRGKSNFIGTEKISFVVNSSANKLSRSLPIDLNNKKSNRSSGCNINNSIDLIQIKRDTLLTSFSDRPHNLCHQGRLDESSSMKEKHMSSAQNLVTKPKPQHEVSKYIISISFFHLILLELQTIILLSFFSNMNISSIFYNLL